MQGGATGEKERRLLKPGEMFGDYTVVKLLGQGGMGAVYLVRAPGGERYAVKILYPDMVKKGTDYRKRFAREAEFAMKIRHKNLISVYDVGEDPETGLCYIIMDYVPGGSVADRLETQGRFAISDAVSIAAQVAMALEVAHSHGVIHRDIKPDNIMFDADGTPKLADLGVAKFSGSTHKTTVTTTGMIIGTPAYMAPEQMMDSHRIDARADLYALGVVLYEMLTGKRPNEGSTAVELLAKAIKGEPLPDVRTMRPEISAAVAHVLSLMCAPKPENRPATASDTARLLQEAAMGRLVLPKKSPRAADARRVARLAKWQLPWTLAAVCVVVGALCAVLVVSLLNRPSPAELPVQVQSITTTNIIQKTIVATNVVKHLVVVTNTIERVAVVTNTIRDERLAPAAAVSDSRTDAQSGSSAGHEPAASEGEANRGGKDASPAVPRASEPARPEPAARREDASPARSIDAQRLFDPDSTKAVQKALDALFPGWKTTQNESRVLRPKKAEPLGFVEAFDGRQNLVCTLPLENGDTPVSLYRYMVLPSGNPILVLSVGKEWLLQSDFRLQVLVDGETVREERVDSSGWRDVAVPLKAWAGKRVKLEIRQHMLRGNPWGRAYWSKIEVTGDVGPARPVRGRELVVFPCAEPGSAKWKSRAPWRYVVQRPVQSGSNGPRWTDPVYRDGSWKRTNKPLGYGWIKKLMHIADRWPTLGLYMRRHFVWKRANVRKVEFVMYHACTVKIFLNGELVLEKNDRNDSWEKIEVPAELFTAALREGDNVLAVEAHDEVGARYFDCGLSVEIEESKMEAVSRQESRSR